MEKREWPDLDRERGRMNPLQFLSLALKPPERRKPLYAIFITLLISVFLDSINCPLDEIFGLVGVSGLCIYLGYLLLCVLPEGWREYPLQRLLAYWSIILGVIMILVYIILRASQIFDFIQSAI